MPPDTPPATQQGGEAGADPDPTPAAPTGPQDGAPTAADAPGTPQDGAPAATPPVQQDGAPPAARQAGAPGQVPGSRAEQAAQAAQAFHDRFEEVLAFEAQVQEYERSSLGRVPAGQLKGARLERRRRLIKDQNTWNLRLESLPGRPLKAPRASQSLRPLEARESAVLRRLSQAYDLSRDTAVLDELQRHNATFLENENWIERDKAVQARDALIQREVDWADVVGQARLLITGGLTPAQLDRLEATLDALSPETRPDQGSPMEQLLADPQRQQKVQAELLMILGQPLDLGLPQASDQELMGLLPGLQAELVKASGLVEPYAELMGLNAELATLEESLADRGVNALEVDARRAAVARKAELVVRQNELNFQVGHSPPSVPEAKALIQAQDALIRRRLFEIGPRGALFAARHDTLDPRGFADLPTPDQWAFLEDQVALITALDEARPAPHPLEGVTMHPPVQGIVLQSDLLGDLPKPGKKPAPGGR